mmetsp:Transcript_2955/g.3459  ORF Transcript_2955/g.3459 Transcript_2955/m.3459 type:complete len:241 (-) Transcript_2955:68-790(-)
MAPLPLSSNKILSSLIQSNKAILLQKSTLLNILESKYGIHQMNDLFTKKCPIIHASIGQHYRHSMDHIELAALVASTNTSSYSSSSKSHDNDLPLTLRYDLRVRGGTLENDVNEARKRIHSVIDIFDELHKINIIHDDNNKDENNGNDCLYSKEEKEKINEKLINKKIYASFMLSSDSNNEEIELMSSTGRELGFCAHHGIHHMAMVRVIAVHTLGLDEEDLPTDFGRAPSTVRFEMNLK